MRDYDYRIDIASDPEFQQHAEIRAAFCVAKRAHAGMSRRKIDPKIPYITHPIMAYDLMRRMGVTDPAVLGATLLHDVREMYPPYIANPLLLEKELKAELEKEWPSGADHLKASWAATDMSALVEQVTNHRVPFAGEAGRGPAKSDTYIESKGMVQMLSTESMSHRAKLIKIADQAANLLDNLKMENGPGFKIEKTKDFAQKARDLVRVIDASDATAPEKRELSRWKKMFRNVYEWNNQLLEAKTPVARTRVREQKGKGFAAMIPAMDAQDRVYPEHTVRRSVFFSKHYPSPNETLLHREDGLFGRPRFGGIARVDLNDEGEVVGFMTWCDPSASQETYRNKMSAIAVSYLRRAGHDVVIDPKLQSLNVDGKSLLEGRYHRLEHPMRPDMFASDMLMVDNINNANRVELLRVARDIARDFFMPETGGASRS